jgi:hypothetical protein
MANVQKHNSCTNVPSSQTFRSYILVYTNVKLPYLKEICSLEWDQRCSLTILAFNIFNAGTKKFILQ